MCAGKTTVSDYLKTAYAATIINADLLGHQAYVQGTEAYEKIVHTFGKEVELPEGGINRRVLGSLVFGNQENMKKLTDIVWPGTFAKQPFFRTCDFVLNNILSLLKAIQNLATKEIQRLREEGGANVVVLEAAVLVEAGWQGL